MDEYVILGLNLKFRSMFSSIVLIEVMMNWENKLTYFLLIFYQFPKMIRVYALFDIFKVSSFNS